MEKQNKSNRFVEKNSQRHRYRTEIYAINTYLRQLEQEKYQSFMRTKIGQALSDSDSESSSDTINDYDFDETSSPYKSQDTNRLSGKSSQKLREAVRTASTRDSTRPSYAV